MQITIDVIVNQFERVNIPKLVLHKLFLTRTHYRLNLSVFNFNTDALTILCEITFEFTGENEHLLLFLKAFSLRQVC